MEYMVKVRVLDRSKFCDKGTNMLNKREGTINYLITWI